MSDASGDKRTLASGDGILCLGPVRSGSFSLVNALKILGYDNIHHAITHHAAKPDLLSLNRASWSCLPYMRTLYPKGPPRWITRGGTLPAQPFGRRDWDELLGKHYRGVSDVGSLYSESLIQAYPEAKVILIQRDFDEWSRSVDAGFLAPLSEGYGWFTRRVVGPLIGSDFLQVQWDVMRAWIQGKTADECRRRLRDIYDEHYAHIRKSVPAGQLLNLRLSDGWEPLCEFLGEPVPDVPFPRLNDTAALQKVRAGTNSRLTRVLLTRVLTCSVLGIILAFVLANRFKVIGTLKGLLN